MAATANFSDRLIDAIRRKGTPACVGFDPFADKLPRAIRARYGIHVGKERSAWDAEAVANAYLEFGSEIIAIVAPHVPVMKINIAFFEPLGPDGWRVYGELTQCAQQAGLIVIGDIKRADIGHSAAQYACAHLAPPSAGTSRPVAGADAVTINPYFGLDGVKPFIDVARQYGRGVFVLVQTSNESASSIQGIVGSDAVPFSHAIAAMVDEWACDADLIGSAGYSCVGAVVSPRDVESTRVLRALMPRSIFLVPGFGAQGRTVDQVALCFSDDGLGAIVNASRSVIYAFDDDRYRTEQQGDWQSCVERSCTEFADAVRQAAKTGR